MYNVLLQLRQLSLHIVVMQSCFSPVFLPSPLCQNLSWLAQSQ